MVDYKCKDCDSYTCICFGTALGTIPMTKQETSERVAEKILGETVALTKRVEQLTELLRLSRKEESRTGYTLLNAYDDVVTHQEALTASLKSRVELFKRNQVLQRIAVAAAAYMTTKHEYDLEYLEALLKTEGMIDVN